MSTQVSPGPSASSAQRPQSLHGKALAALVVGVVAVAVTVATVWLLWTWRHPEVFRAIDAGYAMSAQNPKATRPMYYGMSSELSDSTGKIVISDVKALVGAGGDGARIRFYVCTIDPEGDAGSIGSVSRPALRDECATVVPARRATMELNAHPRQQVVMSVQMSQPRGITIRGIRLTYKHGWQTGTQTIGPSVEYRP
jgi:hypothetical protein